MSFAQSSSLGIVAYLTLFALGGFAFLFGALLLGRFLRPSRPNADKVDVYECGEPAVGSSFIQFDLRFYVVALLFIVFDVEIAFFFPWAAVFGKANHLAAATVPVAKADADGAIAMADEARLLYRELGVASPRLPTTAPDTLDRRGLDKLAPAEQATQIVRQSARQLAWFTLVDIGVFFAVLLVGFAYVWKRGDLDWVRAVGAKP